MRGYIFGSLKFQINLGCLKLLAFSGVEWQNLDPAYVLRKMKLPTPTTTPTSQIKKVLTSSWAERTQIQVPDKWLIDLHCLHDC